MAKLERIRNQVVNYDIGTFPVPYHFNTYKYKEVSKWGGERGEFYIIKIEFWDHGVFEIYIWDHGVFNRGIRSPDRPRFCI